MDILSTSDHSTRDVDIQTATSTFYDPTNSSLGHTLDFHRERAGPSRDSRLESDSSGRLTGLRRLRGGLAGLTVGGERVGDRGVARLIGGQYALHVLLQIAGHAALCRRKTERQT